MKLKMKLSKAAAAIVINQILEDNYLPSIKSVDWNETCTVVVEVHDENITKIVEFLTTEMNFTQHQVIMWIQLESPTSSLFHQLKQMFFTK